jgi:CheY-like chemotaxis protein
VPFDLRSLFGALRGMLKPLLVNPAVHLVCDEPDGLPLLHTDDAKVGQILRNLISNALKFTDEGEVTVAAAFASRPGYVAVTVRDTGVGIAEADQAKLFEEYTQLERTRHRNDRGTGLGLPLSKRLAELLGGTLSVASALGRGSTFVLELPIQYVAPESHSAEVPPAVVTPKEPRKRVLIIDDEEVGRYLIRRTIGEQKFLIEEASSGASGLERARSWRPDVVFLDLVMPGLTGFEVLQGLRSEPATRGIPVIVHSAKELSRDERRFLAQHASAVLSKNEATPDLVLASLHTTLAEPPVPATP